MMKIFTEGGDRFIHRPVYFPSYGSPILDALFKYFMINGSKQTPKIDHDKGGVGCQGKKKEH